MAGSCRINSMSVPESLSWSPSRGQRQRVGEALGEGRTRLLLQPQHPGGDVGGAAGLRAEQHAAQQGRHPGGLPRTEVSSRAWGGDAFRVQTQKWHIQPFLFLLLSRWFPG